MEKSQDRKEELKDRSIVEKEMKENITEETIKSEKLKFKHSDEIYE
ncbi:hypothetical protein SPD48_10405 [Pseudogracilibacillus sp. SE30717A]